MTCLACGHRRDEHDGRECRYADPRTGEAICLCYRARFTDNTKENT